MSSRPDSIMDGLVNRDDMDDDRPGSEHTFASETNTWDTDLEIDGNFGFDFYYTACPRKSGHRNCQHT